MQLEQAKAKALEAYHRRVAEIRSVKPPSLAEFVESTVNFKLHKWQREHLCPLLERCTTEKGLRVAIHAPPRFGKSIIVSQRLPAWLFGLDPEHRVGLACYNETHSTGFGQVVKDLMQSPGYADLFPMTKLNKKDAPAGRFLTTARHALNDANPSFTAMGLDSGFVGRGVDTLIIDDPYKSADDAFSEVKNETVWRWWEQTAGVRMAEDSNVIVMFHRYHEDDFAGRVIAQGFEYYRFPAIADENEDRSDPTNRQPGELLSPMRSMEWLEAQRALSPKVFLGQFQGKPRPDEGAFFRREWFKPHLEHLPKLVRWVRYWDIAVSVKTSADWTVGALVGVGPDNTIYVRDVVRFRMEWPDACQKIVAVATEDALLAQREGWHYHIGVDARAQGLAFFQDLQRKAALIQLPVWPDKSKGDKKERAAGWASRAASDKLRLIPGSWDTQAFINECLAFTGQDIDTDDQVDAVSGAYQLLYQLGGDLLNEQKPISNNSPEYFERLEDYYRSQQASGW